MTQQLLEEYNSLPTAQTRWLINDDFWVWWKL